MVRSHAVEAPGLAVLWLIVCAGFAACGNGGSSSTAPSPLSSASAPATPSPSPSAETSPVPSPLPSPPPPPPPPPLAPGTFAGTIGAAGADVRSGPGTDHPIVAREPGDTAEVFNGWYRRGDDPPVADFKTGGIEVTSQDYLRLADGRGWIHSSNVDGMQPGSMPAVEWPVTRVRNVPIPAAGQRRIVISIARQHLWAFDGSDLVMDTVVATGRPALPTPFGTYHVSAKRSPYHFVSPWPPGSPFWYASAWSAYAMEFISRGYYIHDAPWRTRWGPGANLVAGSHGCVNVPGAPMSALWSWTGIGEEVVVQAS
jgi:lipoprotein-anchoring transpeptidase ErfK/SrfK